jgi:carotenoid 1,2-hydratase
VGSVFSPYYAAARRRGGGIAPAEHYCAVNVALYGPHGGWTMTERGSQALRRDRRSLRIGPSGLHWDGDRLVVELDEVTVPWPSRVRGTVTIDAPRRHHHPMTLDRDGLHRWHPIAPVARIDVSLDQPGLRWQGSGYLDSNHGDAPLESAFRRWDWSRAHLRDGSGVVLYDVEPLDGGASGFALRFGADGVEPVAAPAAAALPASRWGVRRGTRSDGGRATVQATLTDAPFYARSLVRTELFGETVTAMHESLSLERFDTRWVQAMLPFRMPRRA